MSGKVDPFELPREQDLAPPESAVDEATCPACSGEGCGEYARVVNAEFRCDGHGVVTRAKRAAILAESERRNRRGWR